MILYGNLFLYFVWMKRNKSQGSIGFGMTNGNNEQSSVDGGPPEWGPVFPHAPTSYAQIYKYIII